MASEYTMRGGVVACREVTRSIGQGGIITEIWGDYLPLTYCGHDGRIANRTNRLLMGGQQAGRDEQDPGIINVGGRPHIYIETDDKLPVIDDDLTSFKMSAESKFLLIAAAVVVGLLGLVFVFKK